MVSIYLEGTTFEIKHGNFFVVFDIVTFTVKMNLYII